MRNGECGRGGAAESRNAAGGVPHTWASAHHARVSARHAGAGPGAEAPGPAAGQARACVLRNAPDTSATANAAAMRTAPADAMAAP